jgi:mRNA interferase MazF
VAKYSPDRGDIVWLQFDPRTGHEQSARRPALVISPKIYNSKVGLALFCPITSNIKGYPFEAVIPSGSKASGAVLCDQIKSLDWRARRAQKLDRAPTGLLEDVTQKILALVNPT